jgi:hypothetical protein
MVRRIREEYEIAHVKVAFRASFEVLRPVRKDLSVTLPFMIVAFDCHV